MTLWKQRIWCKLILCNVINYFIDMIYVSCNIQFTQAMWAQLPTVLVKIGNLKNSKIAIVRCSVCLQDINMLDLAIVMNAGVPTLDMINMEKEGVVMIHVQEMLTRFAVEAFTILFIS